MHDYSKKVDTPNPPPATPGNPPMRQIQRGACP